MLVAWQGWKIEVPDRWGPVKLEGDADAGYLLMADMHRPRLGLRWKRQNPKRFNAAKAAKLALVNELGTLAAGESQDAPVPEGEWESPLLYEDPEPPGRDVWIGYSKTSSRLFEVVYHAHRRERLLQDRLLPSLVDGDTTTMEDWSIFDLSCRMPPGMKMVKQRLNAGDLGLQFQHSDKRAVNVRQVAMAKLALSRRPLERWLADHMTWRGNHFRPGEKVQEISQSPRLLKQRYVRRRRFVFMLHLAKGYVALAKHDTDRDRLVMVDATTEELAKEVLKSVGWAQQGQG